MRRLAWLLVGVMAAPVAADVIRLRDGGRVEGDIRRADDGYRVTRADGSVTLVPADKVESIEIKPASGTDGAAQRLASLRRSVENLSDLKQIIDRYEKFIASNAGSPVLADAQADLDAWKDRQSRGLVKVGGKWITAAEASEVSRRVTQVAGMLRQTIKQGRLKEAGTVLEKALLDDPGNLSLLYLKGVLQYRQEELPGSRKSFESVIAAAPDHAPTMNNLAVILWRQNAFVAAVGQYDKAMLAAPGSREILDNVAEALNALPEAQRKLPIVLRAVRHFQEQDGDLQKAMAAKGYVRWGSTFVSDSQAEKLNAEEKKIKDQMDQMQQSFDAIQTRLNQIDRTIQSDQQELRLIDQETLQQDGSGRIIRLPYPPRYYDLQREIQALQAERQTQTGAQDRLRHDARQVQQKLSVPRYTGIQRIIDVDGMPVRNSDIAAIEPATAPTTAPTTAPQ